WSSSSHSCNETDLGPSRSPLSLQRWSSSSHSCNETDLGPSRSPLSLQRWSSSSHFCNETDLGPSRAGLPTVDQQTARGCNDPRGPPVMDRCADDPGEPVGASRNERAATD